MLDLWEDLDQGQRRVLVSLAAVVLALAVVSAVVALGRSGGGRVALSTSRGSTTTTGPDVGAGADPGTGTSADGSGPGVTVVGGRTATTHGGPAMTTGAGSKVTSTTTSGSNRTGTTASTGSTITQGSTTTVSGAPCNPGAGGAAADEIANDFCAYRSSKGLPKMTRNGKLDELATHWAQQMASDGKLSHNPSYSQSVLADCSRCTGWAENVADAPTANGVWQEWLRSAGHLANIEDGHAGEYGIGVATTSDGQLWAVQDFGRYP